MTSPVRQWEPILPYPSQESVTDLVFALVERNFGLAIPDEWEENESYYLVTDDATHFTEFREAVEGAIRAAEPAPWLLRDLREFERLIAQDAIEDLQNTPEGQVILDAIRAIAIYRHRQEGQSHDDR